jgi:hypothetical protein
VQKKGRKTAVKSRKCLPIHTHKNSKYYELANILLVKQQRHTPHPFGAGKRALFPRIVSSAAVGALPNGHGTFDY